MKGYTSPAQTLLEKIFLQDARDSYVLNKPISESVSKWDRDRLYTTDIVLIAMGLAEAETFPAIPVRVTINEYVEISKYYSTPKSHGFVNGLLDRLVKQRMAQGIINKNL